MRCSRDPLSALVRPRRSPHLGPERVDFLDDELLHPIYRVLLFEEKVEFLPRGVTSELHHKFLESMRDHTQLGRRARPSGHARRRDMGAPVPVRT